MKSPLTWSLFVLGMVLWLGGQSAVYYFRDEVTRLTEADMDRSSYHEKGDLLKIYNSHLADTRGERFFFNFVTIAGICLACCSGQVARKIQGKRKDSAVPGRPVGDRIDTRP